MHSSRYTLFFTLLMCFIISTLLAGVSTVLKEKQTLNQKIDIQKNILSATGITVEINDVERVYQERVTPLEISKQGNILNQDNNLKKENILKIFQIQDANNNKIAYVYPIVGKGLWSSLYGYLSVDETGKKVIGIAFYKHGETPGLGAEIEKTWFMNNFIGKDLYSKNNKFIGVLVAKGKAKQHTFYKTYPNSIVDGISGATITSKGVEKMLHNEPLKYEKFFNKQK